MVNLSSSWIALAAVLVLLAAVVMAQEPGTPEAQQRMHDLASLQNIGGLAGWAGMAHGIRTRALGSGPTDIISQFFGGSGSNSTGSGNGDALSLLKGVVNSMIGILVMIGFCIVFAILTCFICPCFYCCRACGNCGGSKPKTEGYTPKERYCALGTMIVGLVMISIGFIIGLVSNSVVDQGVGDLEFSIEEAFADVGNIPGIIEYALSDIIGDLNTTVHSLVSNLGNLPDQYLGPDGDLAHLVHSTTDKLRELQTDFNYLNGNASAMTDTTQHIEDLYAQIDPIYQSAGDTMTALQQHHVDDPNPGDDWYLDPNCVGFNNFTVLNVTGLFPNFTDILQNITYINISATADSVDNMFTSISDNITASINDAFNSIQETTDNFVTSTQSSINSVLGSVVSIFNQVGSIRNGTLQPILDTYVDPTEHWRNIIMAVLFSFSMVAVVICLLGFFCKKSPIMTCSAVFCFFLIIIYWILCLIHLIIASPLGFVCDIYYDRSILDVIPQSLLTGLVPARRSIDVRSDPLSGFGNFSQLPFMQNQSVAAYVDLFYDGLDYCHNGGNIVDFLNLTQVVNFTQVVDDFVDQTNFTSIVNQINITGILDDIDFTAGLNFSQVSSYLVYLTSDYSVYINLLENVAYDPLQNATDTAINTLNILLNDSAYLDTCILGTTTNRTAVTIEVTDQLQTVHDDLVAVNNTQLADIRSSIATSRQILNAFSLEANITADLFTDLISNLTTVQAQFVQIGDDFKNQVLTHTVPNGINTILNLVNSTLNTVRNATNCQWAADDFMGTINSFCIMAVGGLDAVWYTCGYLGLLLVLAIVGITLVAKRWIRADTMDQEFGDDYYQNNEFELPPMYSDSVGQSGKE